MRPPRLLLADLPDADWLGSGGGLRVRPIACALPDWLTPEPLQGAPLLSPVHFELGSERIHLRRLTADLPDADEMGALADSLQPLGLRLERLEGEVWRVVEGAPGALRAVALPAMEGRSIGPLMPEPRIWHGLMNEIQMRWHDHPVNRVREAEGRLPVNAAWPWARPSADDSEGLVSDDPVVCWLAGSARATDGPLPALRQGGGLLVPAAGSAEAWLQALLEALHDGRIPGLWLVEHAGRGLALRRRRRLFGAWPWRRRR